MRKLLFILTLLLPLVGYNQCYTGTPPTLTCGTQISVPVNTASGQYGALSTSAPSCSGAGDKWTHSDIYQFTYTPGMVLEIDLTVIGAFMEIFSSDGCTSYACEYFKVSGASIDGSSYIQDAASLNGVARFPIGLDDIGLVDGTTYLMKYSAIANCGGSACTSASIGTRAYTVDCFDTPASSCETAPTLSGNTSYSITNDHSADNSADPNGVGIDCAYSIENNVMYRWCTDASNTQVVVEITNMVINAGTNIQFSIIDDMCGGDYTDIQCESGISTDQNITITGTVASTCYWISFDGNAGTWFDADIYLRDAITILPIELVSFDARKSNDDISLKWITASEINNDHFEIYWSENSKDWEIIKTIGGAGNSSMYLTYTTIHKDPSTENYYKLKQIDFDGQSSTSKIIHVSMDNIEDELEVYRIYDMLGTDRTDDNYYKGFKIVKYTDGSVEKIYDR